MNQGVIPAGNQESVRKNASSIPSFDKKILRQIISAKFQPCVESDHWDDCAGQQ
jgi:hypothetical protein